MTNAPHIAELVKRLDVLESRVAVEELVAGYVHALDRGDRELMATLWHDDAVLDMGEAAVFSGLPEILRGAEGFWQGLEWMHHWCPNALITIEGDAAKAIVNLDCVVRRAEGPAMIAGNYYDSFERRDGIWKFAERKFVLDYRTPLHDWKPVHGPQR